MCDFAWPCLQVPVEKKAFKILRIAIPPFTRSKRNQLPSGKHTKNDGKSPFYSWVNPLFRLGHFPIKPVFSSGTWCLWVDQKFGKERTLVNSWWWISTVIMHQKQLQSLLYPKGYITGYNHSKKQKKSSPTTATQGNARKKQRNVDVPGGDWCSLGWWVAVCWQSPGKILNPDDFMGFHGMTSRFLGRSPRVLWDFIVIKATKNR